jgi:hypothetical protein
LRLTRHFGDARVYLGDGTPESVISVPRLLECWKTRGREIELLTGHFPLCVRELLGERFITFTVLREPVERTLSHLRHNRLLRPNNREKPLEQIYEEPFPHRLVVNHMVKMLSLTVDEMTSGVLTHVTLGPAHLERAKAALESLDLVGVMSRFEEFCSELQAHFALRLGGPVKTNTTIPFAVAREFRERIARDSALDIELYEYACDLVAKRRHQRAMRRDHPSPPAAPGSASPGEEHV